jgi:hypothetical protein
LGSPSKRFDRSWSSKNPDKQLWALEKGKIEVGDVR